LENLPQKRGIKAAEKGKGYKIPVFEKDTIIKIL
jgi:hypothetical protein